MIILGAVVAGCGSPPPTPPPGLDEVQLAGWQAYIDLNCAACHGENREGQRSGPKLLGLDRHWDADKLVSYLTDPDAMVTTDKRLAYKAEQYAIGMPAASGKSPGYAAEAREEKLQALAEYLMVDVRQPGG
jgi:mono/diheme cytochrome c family protein